MNTRWLLALTAVLIGAALVQAQDTIKDRKGFFPNRKQVALKAKEIGILLTDGQPVLSTEGRSGPADQLVFSSNGNSYRWVYVPTTDTPPLISNLQIPVGDKGEKAVYPALNMANPKSVLPWAITQPYTLVEVDVNTGRGSPAGDSFVGTSFRALDGSNDYPLKVAEVIKKLKTAYNDYYLKNDREFSKALTEHGQKVLNGKAPTGPRERKDLMYVTWLTDSQTMRVHFKTTLTDGAYTITNPGGPIRPIDPPPLKLPPKKVSAESLVLRVAPPRKDFPIKTGTTFGIEFGLAYVVDKKGEVIRTETLAIETITQQINAPFIGPGGGPRPAPLPVPPAKDSI